MKKGILAAFLVFLAFMAACTVIAKGIYRAGLARVTVCLPEKMSITHEISGTGSILPGQEFGVYTVENLRVSAVFVQTGERAAAGDALFSVDMQDLAEQIRAAEAEIAYLEAQLKDLEGEKKEQARERERTAARLLADYDSLVREQELQIRDCQLAADSAKLRMQSAEEARNAGQAGSVSGSDLEPDYGAQRNLDAELMKVAYEEALNALEKAKLQKEKAFRDWNRSLEDAGSAGYDSLAQTVQLTGELARSRARLDKLRALEQRQGMISAEADGMIMGSLVKIGERTADGACMILSALDGGDVQVALGEEEAAFLSVGDSVDLQYKTALGEKKKETGIITYIEQGNGQKFLRIRPEEAILLPGQTVHMNASVKSESYECVLPVGALYVEEAAGYYVYVAESREGVLGTEDRVRKMYVTVLEKNSRYAAVEGVALSAESAVVAGSSKALQEDAVVRVLEE